MPRLPLLLAATMLAVTAAFSSAQPPAATPLTRPPNIVIFFADDLATTMDILPTVAGIVGVPLPQGRAIDGQDIRPHPDIVSRLRERLARFTVELAR